MSETKISKAIADYITGILYNYLEIDRHQVGKLQKFKRWIHCGTTGWADRIGFIKQGKNSGKFIAVEVKDPDEGEQGEKQIEFQERVEKSGGFYLLVDSVEDCLEKLKEVLK